MTTSIARVAQLVVAPSLYLGGPRFEPWHAHLLLKVQALAAASDRVGERGVM